MHKIILCSFFILFAHCILVQSTAAFEHRAKRFLTWPTTRSGNVIQIITGVGIPVDLDLETVTMGFVFKVGFLLPKNVSELAHDLNDPFDVSTHQLAPPKRRSLDDYASNESDANDIEDENLYESSNGNSNRVATMRWNVYKGLAKYAERKGLPGRMCVLRSICETARAPFDHSNSILGELMHVIMTPSLTNDAIEDHSNYEYFHAEKLGRDGAPCERIFDECAVSILDQFSNIYTPFE